MREAGASFYGGLPTPNFMRGVVTGDQITASASVSPDPASAGTTLTVTVTASSSTGLPLTYHTPTATGITFTPAAANQWTFTTMSTVLISCEVTDSAGSSKTAITTATVTTGGACAMGSSYSDGCPSAPAGTAQYPTLVNGYGSGGVRAANGNQPPWNIAGVDYAVGYPAGTVLKDPATILSTITGATGNNATKVVTITGANVTIDGYDFTDGWNIYVDKLATNVTITNNHFILQSTSTYGQPIYITYFGDSITQSHGNITINNNIIDGNGIDNGGDALIQAFGNCETGTMMYNWIKNAWSDHVQSEAAYGTNNLTCKYNVFENCSQDTTSPDVHSDIFQTFGGTFGTVIFDFNTVIQKKLGQVAMATQGIQFGGNIGPPTFAAGSMSNNTIVTALFGGQPTATYALSAVPTSMHGVITSNNNYLDPSGCNLPASHLGLYNENNYGVGLGGSLSAAGNVNMNDGSAILYG